MMEWLSFSLLSLSAVFFVVDPMGLGMVTPWSEESRGGLP